MLEAVKRHWPEYLMEAWGLGLFMISAAVFGTLMEHPASPIRQAIADPFLRRIPMGLAMGLTAMGIIYSPWGQQSGAHLNPAVTLTFFRLGKIEPPDVLFYVLSQFTGGLAGVLLVAGVMGAYLADPTVNYVATTPALDRDLTRTTVVILELIRAKGPREGPVFIRRRTDAGREARHSANRNDSADRAAQSRRRFVRISALSTPDGGAVARRGAYG